MPRPDRRIPRIERWLYRRVPGLQNFVRQCFRAVLEGQQLGQRHPRVMRQAQKLGLWNLRRQVQDPVLREALTPRFTLGCKRLMMSNTYYPALTAPNATVVPAALSEVREHSIVASRRQRARGRRAHLRHTGFPRDRSAHRRPGEGALGRVARRVLG
ncbi:MAG: hypothetical protein PGN13_03130 [Patulibacter minatonensis]